MVYFCNPDMLLQSKKLYFLFTLLILSSHFTLPAQAVFMPTISPGSIGKNETAELRLMVENARQVEEIVPPLLNDFIIVSGPNQESGMQSTNGITRQYIGYTYQLQPKKAGRFIIAGAIAKADGKTLRGKPVTLTVTKNSSGSQAAASPGFGGFSPFTEPVAQSSFNDFIIKKGENIAEKINKNIFIKVAVSKPACYVGEPVTVTYKLFTRLKSESSITKNPSFNGFSVIDLLPPGSNNYSVEKLNGREYNVYTLRKSQLYPLQPGNVELESAEVENNIHFIKEEYLNSHRNDLSDMFREFTQTAIPAEGIQDEKVSLQSKQAFIMVKPLPEKDKPVYFKGAVGNFFIDAGVERNSFTTDDAGNLKFAISGEGNMPMVISPDVNWPEGIEPYEPRTKEQLDKFSVPVSGTKLFEYPFTVAKAGTYILPAITFSFYSVKEGKYKTISTKPMSISVTKGVGKKPVIPAGNATAKNGNEPFFDTLLANRWLIVLPVAVLILAGLFIWLQKDKKRHRDWEAETKAGTAKELNEVQVNPLKLTEEKMAGQDTRGFYIALNSELRKFLSERLQIPLATLTKERITEEADKKGISVDAGLQIQRLLDDIEWQVYTPFAAEDKMQEMYNSAEAIVRQMP